jgi:hypothetical protein
MYWSPEDKIVLESFHPVGVLFRLFFEILGLAVNFSVFLLYCLDSYFVTIFVWYSDWAIFFGCAFWSVAIISSLLQLAFYHSEGPVGLSKAAQRWVNIVHRVRDLLMGVLCIQLAMTCISFWISWYMDPYPLPANSIISHSVVWILVIVEMFISVYYLSYWVLLVSVFYTIIYYFFLCWLQYQTGHWQYPALDPSKTPLWYLIVGLMPVAQVIGYYLMRGISWVKNYMVIELQRKWKFDLIRIRLEYALKLKDILRMEISIAVWLLYALVIYGVAIILGCSTHFMNLISWWPWTITLLQVAYGVVETCCFGAHLIYLKRETYTDDFTEKSIARAKVIYSWNVPPLMFQVGFLTMSIDGLVTNWGTPMVWMFFAMMGITAMQITVRLILYYFINKYANVKPYRVTKNTPNEATFYMDGERD